uniref:RRM domain-containing protein n=1 Tax=Araucaria cunninghamii TaxID=56994 RepID=A0A0D6R2J7_ARACU
MGSTTGHPQMPSKVLHIRNLPWECTEEELIELGKPFGKIVRTKVNVGTNRNQAFVEFSDLNQAIAMVSYYASSSEPARVRGRPVYLQYSNRHEIVNGKNSGDEASNVLLVTLDGVEPGDVSIDVLHVVFSAFGFVHKIATFDKGAGFQALVQYSDAETASAARSALDGRSIPRYLLAERVEACYLRINFSAHNDLNIKFQSYRSRDYTNPNLPVAPSAMDGTGQFGVGPDGQRKEPESNVLLASIENMQYAVTADVLHMVFSAFGTVQKILMFEKNGGTQALIQYADVPTAALAKESLEGHCIYDGGFCKLHLSYSRHTDLNLKVNNERSRDYTNAPCQPSILGQQPSGLPGQAVAYPGNQLGTGHVQAPPPPPPPPAGVSGPQQMQSWGYDRLQAPLSQPMALPMPNSMYNVSPVSTAVPSPLQATSSALSMAPYSHQPVHIQAPRGGPLAGGSSTYYM